MDLTILIGIATALLLVLITLYFFKAIRSEKKSPQQNQRAAFQRVPEVLPRRAQIARNQRYRLRQHVAQALPQQAEHSDEGEIGAATATTPQGTITDEKMGTKKRAKLEAKEQKRVQREQELQEREQRKAKQIKWEEERKQQEERETEEERRRSEVARMEQQERERREHEEYLKMKAAFSVEEEGFGETDDKNENLLTDFIQYIKNNKVVILEDLATEFKLKTQQAIELIQELQANGDITGVIDDRGKFIYISEEELASVVKFIKQRGRVSIVELANNSNKLINLSPVTTAAEPKA